MKNKSGFTLVEILVVVLIIGILTAIAVPMYQSAVDKTHWSTLLPTARALKNAEEAHLMATNVYTDNEDALDVAATEGDATYQLQMPDSAARYVIRGSTTKLPNVRLAQYLDENASYANLLFCEAATNDERANKLCEKTLNGQKVYTTDDSYTAYLMDSPCRKGTNYLDSSKCGFVNTNNQTIGQGEVCTGYQDPNNYWSHTCINSTVNQGGVCQAFGKGACDNSVINAGGVCDARQGSSYSCGYSTIEEGGLCMGNGTETCSYSTVKGTVVCEGAVGSRKCGLFNTYDGGICVANVEDGCRAGTFKNGAICYANARNACGIYTSSNPSRSFSDTSCCCGNYCPSDVPRCAPSRCDPQYM